MGLSTTFYIALCVLRVNIVITTNKDKKSCWRDRVKQAQTQGARTPINMSRNSILFLQEIELGKGKQLFVL